MEDGAWTGSGKDAGMPEEDLLSLLQAGLARYDVLVCFDTETTGLSAKKDHLIQVAAKKADLRNGRMEEFNEYVELLSCIALPRNIAKMTGISKRLLREKGLPEEKVLRDFSDFLGDGRVILAAHHIHFDLCFLREAFLHSMFSPRSPDPGIIGAKRKIMEEADFLDTLTIHRDCRPGPHNLGTALYACGIRLTGAHNALNDASGVLKLLLCMVQQEECAVDLSRYINRIGISPKYALKGERIDRIDYFEQGADVHEQTE